MNTPTTELTNQSIATRQVFTLQDVNEYIKTLDEDSVRKLASNITTILNSDEVKHTYREVYELFFQEFKAETIENERSPAALHAYQNINEKYIFGDHLPYESFADQYVEDITVFDVKKLKKEIKLHCKNGKDQPLCHQRLTNIYRNIDKVFSFAADLGYVTVEFCNEIKLKNIGGSKQKSKQVTRNFLDAVEYKTFYETFDELAYTYFKGNKEIRISMLHEIPVDIAPVATFRSLLYRAFYSLIYWTGARVSEARGVLWKDLIQPTKEFPLYRLKIDKQYKEKGAKLIGQQAYTARPKSDSSVRIVTLNMNMVKDLDNLRLYLISRNLYNENNYIFLDFYGQSKVLKPITESSITRCFKMVLEATQIMQKSLVINNVSRNITLHGMRHSACCHLLEKGMPIKEVAKYLGHSNTNMVKYVYSHFIDPAHQSKKEKDENIQYFLK